jgi:hypothetical protein
MSKDDKYPEGHFIGLWIGICMATFTGAWIPISIALKMPGLIGIGPAIGVSIGVAIGASIEAKHKKEGKIRPLTEKEKKNRKNIIWIGIALLFVAVAAFLLVLFLK